MEMTSQLQKNLKNAIRCAMFDHWEIHTSMPRINKYRFLTFDAKNYYIIGINVCDSEMAIGKGTEDSPHSCWWGSAYTGDHSLISFYPIESNEHRIEVTEEEVKALKEVIIDSQGDDEYGLMKYILDTIKVMEL